MSKGYSVIAPIAGVTAYSSQYSTSYRASYAVDGNTSTYWRTATSAVTGAYITVQMEAAAAVSRIRLYISSTSYYPTAWTLAGSNDGETFTDIYSGTCTATSGWQSFSFDNETAYLYYRLTVNTGSSTSRLYLGEMELRGIVPWEKGDGAKLGIRFTEPITGGLDTCAEHFTIRWEEYDAVPGGTLVERSASPEMVEHHPTESQTLLLTMPDLERFCSAVGDISIDYALAGGLFGDGGPVPAFSVTITPEDLIAKPHQRFGEHIEMVSVEAVGTLKRVYYSDAQETEHISITGITAVGTLTHVEDI